MHMNKKEKKKKEKGAILILESLDKWHQDLLVNPHCQLDQIYHHHGKIPMILPTSFQKV